MNKINKTVKILVLLGVSISYSQNNTVDINITNVSSYYTNTMEYNTGEIFVIYDLGNNEVTSKTNNGEKNNLLTSEIKIFPNPTAGLIYFKIPENIVLTSVEVLDNNLKTMYTSTTDLKSISLESYPSGVYYIVFNNDKTLNFKIIKK